MRKILIALMLVWSMNASAQQLHQLHHVCTEDGMGYINCDYNWNE